MLQRPTTTPVPDEIFDYWLTRLGEAELKVLLYIVRRILGFYKQSDAISLSQLCAGVQERDGGTGLCRSAVKDALIALKEKGLIEATRQDSETAGHLPTLYTILWEPLPLAARRAKPLAAEAPPPLAAQPAPQETVLQETGSPLPPASGGAPPPGGESSRACAKTPNQDLDLIAWIQGECVRLNIKPGFQTTSPRAKRALREGDSQGLRLQILHVLEDHAGRPRNVTSLITGLVSATRTRAAPPAQRTPPPPFYNRPPMPLPAEKESPMARVNRVLAKMEAGTL